MGTSMVERLRRRSVRGKAAWGVAAVIGLGGASLVGPTATAAAYDCQQAPICEFVKIDRADHIGYRVHGQYINGNTQRVIYGWSESHEYYTLWHWRTNDTARQRNLKVIVSVFWWDTRNPGRGETGHRFDLSAYQSHCIRIDEAGAYKSSGCNDSQNGRYNIGWR